MKNTAELIEMVGWKAFRYLDSSPRDPRILDAMCAVKRALFVPTEQKANVWHDEPLPIGFEQTCSQPSMVAFMLDKLDIQPGMRILEVGSGCGWTAAIISYLCQPGGRVFACEILPGLMSQSRHNVEQWSNTGYIEAAHAITFINTDASEGIEELGPFDRILFSAGVRSWVPPPQIDSTQLPDGNRANANAPGFNPRPLLRQLTSDGVLMFPERDGFLYRMQKQATKVAIEHWGLVGFVPLIGVNS